MYWAAPRAAPIRVQRGAVNRSSHAIGATVLPLHSHNGIDFVHMYDVPNKFPWLFYELPVLKYILSFCFYCPFNKMKFNARLRKQERIRFVLFFRRIHNESAFPFRNYYERAPKVQFVIKNSRFFLLFIMNQTY